MYYTIYKIVNSINGKIYIGKHQTKDLNDGYMGSGKLLKRAINAYSIENFNKEMLYIYDNEAEMNAKEKELVTEDFCLRGDTYNICVGGQGGFSYINREGINGSKDGRRSAGVRTCNKLWEDTTFIAAHKKRTSLRTKLRIIDGSHTDITLFSHLSKTDTAINKRKKTFAHIKHAQGEKNSQFGSVWITNGTENKKIKNVDNIPEGWYKGRRIFAN